MASRKKEFMGPVGTERESAFPDEERNQGFGGSSSSDMDATHDDGGDDGESTSSKVSVEDNLGVTGKGAAVADVPSIRRAYEKYHQENSPQAAARGIKLATFDELVGKAKSKGTKKDYGNVAAWAGTEQGKHYLARTRAITAPVPWAKPDRFKTDAEGTRTLDENGNPILQKVDNGPIGWQEGVPRAPRDANSESYLHASLFRNMHHGNLQGLADRYMEHYDQNLQYGSGPKSWVGQVRHNEGQVSGGLEDLHGQMLEHLGQSSYAHSTGDHEAGAAHFDAAVKTFRRMTRRGQSLKLPADHRAYEDEARNIHANYKEMNGIQ